MSSFGRRIVDTWVGYGPRFLPFADAASPDLPLGRLLRLSLFQVSVGMALVLLVGTLNRVMIVEHMARCTRCRTGRNRYGRRGRNRRRPGKHFPTCSFHDAFLPVLSCAIPARHGRGMAPVYP